MLQRTAEQGVQHKKFKGGIISMLFLVVIYVGPACSSNITVELAQTAMIYHGLIAGVMMGGQAIHDTFRDRKIKKEDDDSDSSPDSGSQPQD